MLIKTIKILYFQLENVDAAPGNATKVKNFRRSSKKY